jgi:signal transduction histidine kinase
VLYRSAGPDFYDVVQLPTITGLMGKVFSAPQRYNPCDMAPGELARLADEEQLPFVPAAGLCVPLERDTGFVGALAVYWKTGGHSCLTESQERVVELSADQIGHALGQRMARQQVERQDRLAAIGSALSAVLHDLKTPVTVASGYVQLLKMEDDAQERAQLSDLVLSQLAKMTEMTRDVLSFARGDRDLLLRKVLMTELASDLRIALEGVFDGSKVQWQVHCEDRGFARFDLNKVTRALVNLARNARDALDTCAANPDQPLLFQLTLMAQGDQLIFTAQDNGPGVPREFQHRLFEAFATHGKKDGTGIGLAMARRVALAHGGEVEYRETPGGGATFEMHLPRDPQGRRTSERIPNPDMSLAVTPLT